MRDAEQEEALLAEKLFSDEVALKQKMLQLQGGNIALSGSLVGAIISQNSSEISVAAAQYELNIEESKREAEQRALNSIANRLGVIQKQKDSVNEQLAELDGKVAQLKAEMQGTIEKYRAVEAARAAASAQIDELTSAFQQFLTIESQFTPEEKQQFDTLTRLTLTIEDNQQKIAEYKVACKTRLQAMKDKIASFESIAAGGGESEAGSEEARFKEIEDAYATVRGAPHVSTSLSCRTYIQIILFVIIMFIIVVNIIFYFFFLLLLYYVIFAILRPPQTILTALTIPKPTDYTYYVLSTHPYACHADDSEARAPT